MLSIYSQKTVHELLPECPPQHPTLGRRREVFIGSFGYPRDSGCLRNVFSFFPFGLDSGGTWFLSSSPFTPRELRTTHCPGLEICPRPQCCTAALNTPILPLFASLFFCFCPPPRLSQLGRWPPGGYLLFPVCHGSALLKVHPTIALIVFSPFSRSTSFNLLRLASYSKPLAVLPNFRKWVWRQNFNPCPFFPTPLDLPQSFWGTVLLPV